MRKRKISGERVITSALVLLLLPGTSLRIACAEQSDSPPRDIAVYVRDFELSVAPAAAPDPPNPGSTNRSKTCSCGRSRFKTILRRRSSKPCGSRGAARERNPVRRRVSRAGSREPDPSGAAGQRLTWDQVHIVCGSIRPEKRGSAAV